jgi:hypothetical protein
MSKQKEPDTIEIEKCNALARDLQARANTLKDAFADMCRMNIEGRRGVADPFLRGQAAAYEKAAELIKAMYELPF